MSAIAKVGIDARLSGQQHAGIGRYIENLLKKLLEITPSSIQYTVFFHHKQQLNQFATHYPLAKKAHLVLAPYRHYSWSEQTRWLKQLNQFQLDLLHVPHFNIPLCYRRPMVVTIHDLLWHQQIGPEATTLPSWKYYLKYLAYRVVAAQAINRAKTILVPSKAVSKQIQIYHPQTVSKIVVAYEGVAESFLKAATKKLSLANTQQRIQSKNLVYLGSLYPHKNIKVVLQALQTLTDYQLSIVSARNVFVERTKLQVRELGLQKRINFLGNLNDEALLEILLSAFALVQPSLSEGFGLTGLEAMAAHTPVIASSLDVFHEIYQDAPVFFNPHDSKSLVEAIVSLSSPDRYRQSIVRGQKTASRYSWLKTAETTLNRYQQLLS
ncbi:MAG TPA: glycosyltransferase family 1 protein [Candidatus Woesebacteria bacterium]|nr:glycosyltransferase family 1 protein [Candidatus Woesebacteria bacterium]